MMAVKELPLLKILPSENIFWGSPTSTFIFSLNSSLFLVPGEHSLMNLAGQPGYQASNLQCYYTFSFIFLILIGHSHSMEKKSPGKTVYKSANFEIVQEKFSLGHDNQVNIEYLKKADAVLGVLISDGKLGLIRVKRPHVGESYELVGGRMEPSDKTPEEAMQREMKEEIGISSADIRALGTTFPLPSITNEMVYLFEVVLDGELQVTINHKEGITEFGFYTLNEVLHMIKSNMIKCSADAYAIMLYALTKGFYK